MKALKIILGIVLLLAGILSFVFPGFAVSLATLVLLIVMLVWGIVQIVRFASHNKEERKELAIGGASLACGIILAVLAILIFVIPGAKAVLMVFIVVFFAVAMFIRGIDLMVTSIAMKQNLSGGLFALYLILSILLIVLGILCIANLFAAWNLLNILLAIALLVGGVACICMPAREEKE